jgi:hypothetical protein
MAQVQFPVGQGIPLLHGSLVSNGHLGVSQGVFQLSDHEGDYSPPFGVKVKNGEAIPPLPYLSSWNNAYLFKHMGKFTSMQFMQCNNLCPIKTFIKYFLQNVS